MMDGLLILVEASGACAIAALIARTGELWYERHYQSQRHKQLLIQAPDESTGDLSTTRNLHFSDRRFEMELLLMQLSAKAGLLLDALAAEVKCGEKARAADTEAPWCFGQWQEARRSVQQAQGVYCEALEDYHEFLHSLPPPLRAKAVQRGALAMAMSPA